MDSIHKMLEFAKQYQGQDFLEKFFQDPNKLMSSPLNSQLQASAFKEWSFPKIDVYEEGGQVIIEADVPGLDADTVKVHYANNLLTLSGNAVTLVPSRKYFHKERYSGSFEKQVSLPFPGDPQTMSITHEGHLMKIRIRKKNEEKSHIPLF